MKHKFIFWTGLITLILLIAYWFHRPKNHLQIIACQVGQADAVLLQIKTTQIVIDTGLENNRVLNCLGQHLPFYDRTIELVIITHPDADHIGGLPAILNRYRVKGLLVGQGIDTTELGSTALKLAADRKIGIKTATAGDRLLLWSLELNLIWPPAKPDPGIKDLNDLSLVIYLKYGAFSGLFTGDISSQIEAQLPFTGPVSLLKVAHHGSRFSTGQAFLELVKPNIALIMAGTDNSYNHPHPDTLDRLNQIGTLIFRTDTGGDQIIYTDGQKIWW